MRAGWFIAMVLPAAAIAGVSTGPASRPTGSLARTPDENSRCALRVALSLTGQVPTDALATSSDPQSGAAALLETPAFDEQFARFVNSKLNDDPGLKAADDATYWLAKYVLENHKPWHGLFDGPPGEGPIKQVLEACGYVLGQIPVREPAPAPAQKDSGQ